MGMAVVVVKERRARARVEMKGRVRILWEENGLARQTTAELQNISTNGMSCLVPQRLAARTEIRVEWPGQHLHGDAYVRHCNNRGANYLIGIEFRGGMTWRAPGAERERGRWD